MTRNGSFSFIFVLFFEYILVILNDNIEVMIKNDIRTSKSKIIKTFVFFFNK